MSVKQKYDEPKIIKKREKKAEEKAAKKIPITKPDEQVVKENKWEKVYDSAVSGVTNLMQKQTKKLEEQKK